MTGHFPRSAELLNLSWIRKAQTTPHRSRNQNQSRSNRTRPTDRRSALERAVHRLMTNVHETAGQRATDARPANPRGEPQVFEDESQSQPCRASAKPGRKIVRHANQDENHVERVQGESRLGGARARTLQRPGVSSQGIKKTTTSMAINPAQMRPPGSLRVEYGKESGEHCEN